MNYDDYKTGLHDSNSPINQEDLPDTEVTIDESWYNELQDDFKTLRKAKSLFRQWYKLNSFPLEKTSDEKIRLANLENELIKILG